MQQREQLLLLRARESGQIPYPSPRQNHPAHQSNVPPLQLEEAHDDNHNSPRKHEEDVRPPPDQPTHNQRRHYHDESPRKRAAPEHSDQHEHSKYPGKDDGKIDRIDRIPVRSKDDSFVRDGKEKYQWYNERHLSPPLEVRRSRSLSPPPLNLEELHRELEQKREELQVEVIELEQHVY